MAEFATHMAEFATHKADNTAHGGIYRKNLLHNWDFSIWQRGTSFPSNESDNKVFTADRWKCAWHKGVERIPNTSPHKSLYAIKITTMNVVSNGNYITQHIENLSNLKGATLTLSAYVKASAACVIRLMIQPLDGDARITSRNVNAGEWQLVTQTITLGSSGIDWVRINTGAIAADETIEIGAVKLELGDKSTLANDPPADYGEQLALCQRYYQTISHDPVGTGYISGAGTTAYITVPTPVTMRTTPTLVGATAGDFRVRQKATDITPTAFGIVEYDNLIVLRFTVEGATAREIAGAYTTGGKSIALSADL